RLRAGANVAWSLRKAVCPPKRWSHMHRRLHLAYVASLLVALAVALLSSDLVAAQGNEAQGPNGAQLCAATCSGCHPAQGHGVPGACPPLARHAQGVYGAAGGPP